MSTRSSGAIGNRSRRQVVKPGNPPDAALRGRVTGVLSFIHPMEAFRDYEQKNESAWRR
jgi:hypothetical protein